MWGEEGPRDRAPGVNKNGIEPWLKKEWCIPPEHDVEFVCPMEDLLDLYQQPYNPKEPVVCLDELTKQLVEEVRAPLPMEPGRAEHYDRHYRRNGSLRCS